MFEAQWMCRGSQGSASSVTFPRSTRTFEPGTNVRWRRREGEEKVQLLKAPQFMQEVGAVLKAFPGARILWVRRDLREVAASSASLVWHQRRIQSDAVDRSEIGHEWLRKTELRERRALAALREQRAATIVVDYAAANLDWQSEIRRIYRFLDFDLPHTIVKRMSRVARSNAHKGHVYSGQQFGLDA